MKMIKNFVASAKVINCLFYTCFDISAKVVACAKVINCFFYTCFIHFF